MSSRIVFHVGYPKTGTTTLQSRVFPHHRDIGYLGKLIPDFGYSHDELAGAVAQITTTSEACWTAQAPIREYFSALRERSGGRLLLVSSENFIHPASICPVQVAERLASIAPDAEILITLRAQHSLLRSFFRNHGAFGSYTYLAKGETESIALPFTLDEWLTLLLRAPHKGLIDTLHFDAVIGRYESLFGERSVHVALYEELEADPEAYARRLAGMLAVDGPEFERLLADHHDNAGLAPEGFEALSQRVRHPVTVFNAAATPPSPASENRKPKEIVFAQSFMERLNSIYAEGNTRLSKRRNLELARRGYAAGCDQAG